MVSRMLICTPFAFMNVALDYNGKRLARVRESKMSGDILAMSLLIHPRYCLARQNSVHTRVIWRVSCP
jgi:hypothetical protein